MTVQCLASHTTWLCTRENFPRPVMTLVGLSASRRKKEVEPSLVRKAVFLPVLSQDMISMGYMCEYEPVCAELVCVCVCVCVLHGTVGRQFRVVFRVIPVFGAIVRVRSRTKLYAKLH